MGYWLTKDLINKKTYFPRYSFYNNGTFNVSYYSADEQKSNWKKTGEKTYEITERIYSDYEQGFSAPRKSRFVIEDNGTATLYYMDSRTSSERTSTWYYKGVAYHAHGLSESEMLTPSPLKN